MRIYLTSLISGGLMLAAIVAVIILHGGWEAAVAGFAILAATVWFGCFLVMLVREEGETAALPPHPV
jgi:hypothetical protein